MNVANPVIQFEFISCKLVKWLDVRINLEPYQAIKTPRYEFNWLFLFFIWNIFWWV